MNIRLHFIASILLLLFCLPGPVFALSPEDIVKKADEARAPGGDFSVIVKVKDKEGDSESMETTYKVFSKGSDLTLVTTVAPERLMGRKLLMRGTDLWLYLPSVHRPTRVGFQQRLTGEVSNGDIARTNFAKDYDAKLIGEVKWGGQPCYQLLLSAKRKDVTYNSLKYWVAKSNNQPLKAEFYALSGKLLKTGTYDSYTPALGQPRLSQMTITDAIHPSKKSILRYINYRREKLNERLFNKESLAR